MASSPALVFSLVQQSNEQASDKLFDCVQFREKALPEFRQLLINCLQHIEPGVFQVCGTEALSLVARSNSASE
jgi:hypothetical protein